MKNFILLCAFLSTVGAYAQKNAGIDFQERLNWTAIKAKAKAEHKPIFIDAYATWCVPCKHMDATVYNQPMVGEEMNKQFISVKVQMDSTKVDNEFVKSWRKDAEKIKKDFGVGVFPTYLFLSPEGQLIHRGTGLKKPDEFIKLVKTAANPKENLAGQKALLQQGKLSPQEILDLALLAYRLREKDTGMLAAEQYKRYLASSEPSKHMTADTIDYIFYYQVLFSIDDPIISYLYKHPERAEAVVKGGNEKAMGLTDFYIKKKLVWTKLLENGKAAKQVPDWIAMERSIAKSYDEQTAKRLTLEGKIWWYTVTKDFKNAAKFEIEKLDTYGVNLKDGFKRGWLNTMTWQVIFEQNTDPEVLKKGLSFIEMLLKEEPNNYHFLDTYANLFYKLSDKDKALEAERLAISLAEQKKDQKSIKAFQETLEKMIANQPTWPTSTP